MKKLQDLTDEEVDNMSDEEIAQLECENGGSGILPQGSRARHLRNTIGDNFEQILSNGKE